MSDFSDKQITVTMSGRQWFALLARVVGKSLSLDGAKAYNEASAILKEELLKHK